MEVAHVPGLDISNECNEWTWPGHMLLFFANTFEDEVELEGGGSMFLPPSTV